MVVLYSVASSGRSDHLKLQTVITNILPPKIHQLPFYKNCQECRHYRNTSMIGAAFILTFIGREHLLIALDYEYEVMFFNLKLSVVVIKIMIHCKKLNLTFQVILTNAMQISSVILKYIMT